jgi:hypothetical protein
VLCHSIRERYHTTKSDKARQLLASMVASNLLRKYQLMRTCRKSTGISERRLSSSANYKVATYSYVREPYKSKTYRLRNIICSFLERDDNSRITTSKSDTITRHENKKQRRLLTDRPTMTRLYAKYKNENPTSTVSHSTFCSLRPFWIVQPSARDRETCLCKLHENGNLVVS